MPMTRARTWPPSGLLSCNGLAARALSRSTLDADSKAMATNIFQDPNIAHSLSKFRITRFVQTSDMLGQKKDKVPDAPQPNFRTRTWANTRSSLARLARFTACEVHRLPLAGFFDRPVGASA